MEASHSQRHAKGQSRRRHGPLFPDHLVDNAVEREPASMAYVGVNPFLVRPNMAPGEANLGAHFPLMQTLPAQPPSAWSGAVP